ncbi:MAG TPA: response regulator [Bacteroidota bacterium]
MTKRSARILAVDDDRTMLNLIREVLSKEKFHITTVEGGKEGMKVLNRSRFDLILLDIDMPDVNGFDVLRHIRSRSSDVKVVMVTGLNDLESGVRAMESGANGYITKPFNVKDFVSEVRRVLEL